MTRPLHIVHYLPRIRLADGGVVRAVLDMCQILSMCESKVTLVTHEPGDTPREWLDQSSGSPMVRITAGGSRLGRFPAVSKHALRRILADADVLHLHTPWEVNNLVFAKVARSMCIPYIVSLHGMLDDWCMAQRGIKKRIYLAVAGRRFLEQAAYVHCTAEAEMQQAKAWFPRGRPLVLPLIFDVSPFTKLPGPDMARDQLKCLSKDKPNLLFLSRVHVKKRPDLLIDAAAQLRNAGTPVNVIIAGPGEPTYIEDLRQRAASFGLEDLVHFPGMVDGPLKLSLYQAADVFVLPSSQENFGLVLAEAMACGTPVITTKGVDIWRELEAAGGVVIEQSAFAIADGIACLLRDAGALEQRGKQCREYVFDWLEPHGVAAQYQHTYVTSSPIGYVKSVRH